MFLCSLLIRINSIILQIPNHRVIHIKRFLSDLKKEYIKIIKVVVVLFSVSINLRYTLLFFILLSFSAQAAKKEINDKFYEPMRFALAGDGGNCNGCEWISAIGVIDETTPKKFERFYKKYSSYSTSVHFHSPGGNLIAGMELGRLLRQYKVPVYINETKKLETLRAYDDYSDEWRQTTVKGICASACAYAFLGGISRSIDKDSKIGFHQFYNSADQGDFSKHIKIGNSQLSVDQVFSGLIAGYLAEMGVDSRVLTLASVAGNNQLLSLNDAELKVLNIVTDHGPSPMQMEQFKGGIRVFSTNNYVGYPVREISAFCLKHNYKPVFMIEANKVSSSQDIKQSIWSIEFSSDDTKFPISKDNLDIIYGEQTDGIIIYLSDELKEYALNSKKFGISIDSPRSLWGTWVGGGFTLTDEERGMLRLAWSNCISRPQ